MVREIQDNGFKKEVIDNKGTVLLLVYVPWCGDCQRILPVFNNLSCLSAHGEVCFLQMDVDKNPETKKSLKVERYPTLCLFKDGRKAGEQVAEVSTEKQKAIIQSLLGQAPTQP
jgi:thioredoxin 1